MDDTAQELRVSDLASLMEPRIDAQFDQCGGFITEEQDIASPCRQFPGRKRGFTTPERLRAPLPIF